MTTKELLALVERWHSYADSAMRNSGTWSGDQMADRVAYMADELAPIATALCAEVEALRDALNVAYRHLPTSSMNAHDLALIRAAKEPK